MQFNLNFRPLDEKDHPFISCSGLVGHSCNRINNGSQLTNSSTEETIVLSVVSAAAQSWFPGQHDSQSPGCRSLHSEIHTISGQCLYNEDLVSEGLVLSHREPVCVWTNYLTARDSFCICKKGVNNALLPGPRQRPSNIVCVKGHWEGWLSLSFLLHHLIWVPRGPPSKWQIILTFPTTDQFRRFDFKNKQTKNLNNQLFKSSKSQLVSLTQTSYDSCVCC